MNKRIAKKILGKVLDLESNHNYSRAQIRKIGKYFKKQMRHKLGNEMIFNTVQTRYAIVKGMKAAFKI